VRLTEIKGSPTFPAAFSGFDSLISPLTIDAFREKYFQHQPFYINRDCAGYFDSIIEIDELDRLLSHEVFYPSDIRVACRGRILDPSEFLSQNADGLTLVSRSRLLELYLKGATIVFEHLERKHSHLISLLARCESEFGVPFRANCYLTPASSSGFSLHYDTHDVVILQIAGKKIWRIHDNPIPLPAIDQPYQTTYGNQSRLIAEIELRPGSVLYLPRGYIHAADSQDDGSLHVTIGIHSQTLRDFAMWTFGRELPRSHTRDAPSGYRVGRAALEDVRRTIESIAMRMQIDQARTAATINFQRKRMRPYDDAIHVRSLRDIARRELTLRLDPCAIMTLIPDGDHVQTHFDTAMLSVPNKFGAALQRIATGVPFSISQLPGLDRLEQKEICQKLCRHRLLISAEHSETHGTSDLPSTSGQCNPDGDSPDARSAPTGNVSDLVAAISIETLRKAVSARAFRMEEIAVISVDGTNPKSFGRYIDQQWIFDALEGSTQLIFRDVHRTISNLHHPVSRIAERLGRPLAVDGCVLHANAAPVVWTAEDGDFDILQADGSSDIRKTSDLTGTRRSWGLTERLNRGDRFHVPKGHSVRVQAIGRTSIQLRLRWRCITYKELVLRAIESSMSRMPDNPRSTATSPLPVRVAEQLLDAVPSPEFMSLMNGEYWRLREHGGNLTTDLVIKRIDRSSAITEKCLIRLLRNKEWSLITAGSRGALHEFIQVDGASWRLTAKESAALVELKRQNTMVISQLPLDKPSERVHLARLLTAVGIADAIANIHGSL
jgi:hypothetical protein